MGEQPADRATADADGREVEVALEGGVIDGGQVPVRRLVRLAGIVARGGKIYLQRPRPVGEVRDAGPSDVRWAALSGVCAQSLQPHLMPLPHALRHQNAAEPRHESMLGFLSNHATPVAGLLDQPSMVYVEPEPVTVPGDALTGNELQHG